MYKIILGTYIDDEVVYKTTSYNKALQFFNTNEYTNFNDTKIVMSIFENNKLIKTKN